MDKLPESAQSTNLISNSPLVVGGIDAANSNHLSAESSGGNVSNDSSPNSVPKIDSKDNRGSAYDSSRSETAVSACTPVAPQIMKVGETPNAVTAAAQPCSKCSCTVPSSSVELKVSTDELKR